MKNENLNNNYIYRSADLALCAMIFLYKPLAGIDKQNPRRAEFLFERSQELNDLVERFWRRELKVDPRAYFDALRSIKARLYDR